MKFAITSTLLLLLVTAPSNAAPSLPEPNPSLATTVTFGGKQFINKGLVALGIIPANATDSFGETIGGIGSAIALKRGTFKAVSGGKFEGTLIVQPDRGHNTVGTIDYRARQHAVDFVLKPYYGTANLALADAKKTLKLTYKTTKLYYDRGHKDTSGLDALATRPVSEFFNDPPMPIPSIWENHLTLDDEGLVLNSDGTFWVGDEYGAYIYKFDKHGNLLHVLTPPQAVQPLIGGALNFTASINPDTGRTPNQGFEGLTASPGGKTLYALLQSATIQDGGASKKQNRHTRLFSWDVSGKTPKLTGEWVVPLPIDSSGKTYAQSELHYLNSHQFLVLARDGNGHGNSDPTSIYKSIDLIDISGATDIHGTKFDGLTPISPGGVLDPSIIPAQYQSFVSIIDPVQLARFGLHNGDPVDQTLIDCKFESIALAPVDDPKYPNDYFLFTMADNDFITVDGFAVGQPYSDPYGQDVDTQALVFRVTLPTVPKGSVQKYIGI